jgi:hypothetical protein
MTKYRTTGTVKISTEMSSSFPAMGKAGNDTRGEWTLLEHFSYYY